MIPEEQRRSPRYVDFLPIRLAVRKIADTSLVAGPLSARIVDVSNHGARLIMTQVMVDAYHIFHSTREDDSVALTLLITLPAFPEPIEIHSRPIWLNATKLEDIKVFKMGVDFTAALDNDILQAISRQINTP